MTNASDFPDVLYVSADVVDDGIAYLADSAKEALIGSTPVEVAEYRLVRKATYKVERVIRKVGKK